MKLDYACCTCGQRFTFDNGKDLLNFEVTREGKTLVYCSIDCKFKKRKKHKFRAKPCEEDAIKFGSKAERNYYIGLKNKQAAGEVVFFLRQVPFDLPGNTKYFVDFQVFYKDGTVAFVDVKGMSTPLFIMKKKQVEDLYPIEIEVVH